MKIGILTFHREINKGAVVQSFCLQQKLEKQFPNSEVEIVDYRPPFMQEGATFTSLKLSLAQLIFQHIPDYYFKHREEVRAVQEFIDSNYNLSSDYCESPNLNKAAIFLKNKDMTQFLSAAILSGVYRKTEGFLHHQISICYRI